MIEWDITVSKPRRMFQGDLISGIVPHLLLVQITENFKPLPPPSGIDVNPFFAPFLNDLCMPLVALNLHVYLVGDNAGPLDCLLRTLLLGSGLCGFLFPFGYSCIRCECGFWVLGR